jgi:hypothetical protein
MSSLKNEIEVSHGRYKTWISRKWGYVINPDYIDRWGVEAIREYAQFCLLLAEAKEKWYSEHYKASKGCRK